ncbi:Lipase-3 domain-containing protein [Aphelenchoides bicaudatus]|nr:Lipase-3 domain-containing protein [Aphelenchoides bicaudatus]
MSSTRLLTVLLVLLSSSLLATAGFSTVYDDTFARWFVKVSGAAYSKSPDKCLQNIDELGDDWSVALVHETRCSPFLSEQSRCQVVVFKSDVQKQYIVAFRGSVGNKQLVEQVLEASPVKFENFGLVSDYLQKSFYTLWPSVLGQIKNAKQEGYSIIVTGFSLGGALSHITALKIVSGGIQTSDNVYLLTFGSPRIGNHEFAKNVDKAIKFRHRVVNKNDLIPHFPPCWPSLFQPNTCTTLISDNYYHSQQEIWYAAGSSAPGSPYITTTTNEDPKGSNRVSINLKVADHLTYFGYDLEKYGLNNCA